MASEWRTLELGELGRIITGKTPLTSVEANFGGAVPFVTPSDMDGRKYIEKTARTLTARGVGCVKSAVLPAQAVMVSCIGSDMGKVGLTETQCVTNQQINAIVVHDEFNPQYVYYDLLRRKTELRSLAAGSAQPILNKGHFAQIPIQIPSRDAQDRITRILGTLDDKIELNRRMNRTLEKMAAALFKSWFIDFDPVHAKAEHRDTGLAAAVADLFPDTFQPSTLGLIPTGWTVKLIGEAVCCVGGATPNTKNPDFWEGGTHPFITPKDLSQLNSPVILDSERHITDAGVQKISSKQLPAGTVILSSRAPIGYLGIATVPVSVNQGIIAMVCDADLTNLYILHWTRANMDAIKSRAGGTTFAEISKKNFRPIPVLVPPNDVVDAFMSQASPIHQRILSAARENVELASLRDLLLPKLLNGALQVPIFADTGGQP